MNKRGPYQPPRAERFAARTTQGSAPAHLPDLGPCLLWTGVRLKKRGMYGCFYDDDQRLRRAHRVAWELATGDTLTSDQHVLHRCDNPPCVRFEHLRLGDQPANMADMNEKGRRTEVAPPCGEMHYGAILTDAIVLDARMRFAAGEEVPDITAGHSYAFALKAAIYGASWRHVPMPDYSARERPVGQSRARCPQGHLFTADNTAHSIDRKGHRSRYCKQCNRDRANANARKRREGRTAALA